MRAPIPNLVLACVVLAAGAAGAEPRGSTRAVDPVAARVGRALARRPAGARVGLLVRDLTRKKRVCARNADTPISLASNTKLFTTAAALSELGPDYRFKTSIIASGVVSRGVLHGDLVVRGGGDPNISGRFHKGDAMAVPRAWAAAVRKSGVYRITGDLVVDDRFFDSLRVAPGWPRGQSLAWYAAPVGALSFNDNCVKVVVTGGSRAGAGSAARVRPLFNGVRIVNRSRTVGSRAAARLRVGRIGPLTFVAGGSIRARTTRARKAVTVGDPGLFLGYAFSYALRSGGVALGGSVRRVTRSEPLRPRKTLLVWQSSLLESIGVANKRSQNLYAEMILKTLGAEKFKTGSFANGVRAIAKFHRRIGLARGNAFLCDGSGLSRANRARPSAVVHLLDWMFRSPNAAAFRNSLSIAGVDGTLRNRLNNLSCKRRVFAKTGTLATAAALSGYALSRNGRWYAFSVLCDRLRDKNQARHFQNEICNAIVGAP